MSSEALPQTDELAKKQSPTDRKTQRIRSVGFFNPLEKLAPFVKVFGAQNFSEPRFIRWSFFHPLGYNSA